jgi:glutathione peroxidase
VHQKFKDRGFSVLGFPCNQFGGQEPGSDKEIQEFVCSRFNATFPVFAKIDVKGDAAHPLFQYLGKAAPGIFGREAPWWNFTFFLIDRTGTHVTRYAPTTTAESITADIEKLL